MALAECRQPVSGGRYGFVYRQLRLRLQCLIYRFVRDVQEPARFRGSQHGDGMTVLLDHNIDAVLYLLQHRVEVARQLRFGDV